MQELIESENVEKLAWEKAFTDSNWLRSVCVELGWQGGTIHQVIAEIEKRKKGKFCLYDTRTGVFWENACYGSYIIIKDCYTEIKRIVDTLIKEYGDCVIGRYKIIDEKTAQKMADSTNNGRIMLTI